MEQQHKNPVLKEFSITCATTGPFRVIGLTITLVASPPALNLTSPHEDALTAHQNKIDLSSS